MDKELDVMNFVDRDEILRNQRRAVIEKNKIEKEKQLQNRSKIKNISFKVGIAILIVGSTITVVKEWKFQTKPVTIVSNDMLANASLSEIYGKKVTAKEFGINETKAMYDYIVENNISQEQIYDTIHKLCNQSGVDYNFALAKLYELYPEIFENALTEESNKHL